MNDDLGRVPAIGGSRLEQRSPVRWVVPALSLAGLIVAGLVTWQLYRNPIPVLPGRAAGTASTAPSLTPGSSGAVVERISVPGMIAYVREGGVWVQTGTSAKQITTSVEGSEASAPAWSGDGKWIYYIDTRITKGQWYNPNVGGYLSDYTLKYPVLCRVRPDGSDRKDILSGLIKQGSLKTFYWLRQPSIAPDGRTAAVISAGPQPPGFADTLVHLVSLGSGTLQPALPLRENHPFGHADPTYSPSGSLIAYVMEGRSGNNGAPSIWVYDASKGTARRLASGYRGPSWSPDGKYLAATKVSGQKLDIVVLDVKSGKQVGQVTTDGVSWAPVWSPAGDEIVYMSLHDGIVDLNMVHLSQTGGQFAFTVEPNLIDYSDLDGGSRAAWYIPPEEAIPTATASPS